MSDEPDLVISSPQRLATVRSLLAGSRQPLQDALDRLTWLASEVLQAPVALVSLVGDERQVFASQVGLREPLATTRETPLTHSFCKHVVAAAAPLVIADVQEHPLVRDYPDVFEVGARAYAGVPLATGSGDLLGSFCVLDTAPRPWTEREVEILRRLAASAMTEVDLILAAAEAERTAARLRDAQRDLAVAEEHYRRLVTTSPVGIYALDREGRGTEANLAMARITGRPTADLVGIHFGDVLVPEYREVAEHVLGRIVAGEIEDLDLELEIQRPDGERRLAAVSVTSIRVGTRITGVHGIMRDVTDRRHAEEQLRRSEERYRSFFDADITADVLVAPGGEVIDCNPAFLRIFGFDSRNDAAAHSLASIYPDRASLDSFFERVRREGRIEHHEQVLLRRDGRSVDVIENAFGIFDDRGELVQVQKYLFDITAHRALEEQFRQAQKMEAVGRLAGGVAHDFNNMLTAITGYAQLLLDELEAGNPMRQELQFILGAAQRSADLTRQLLAFSRKQVLQPKVIDLNAVVSELAAMLRRMIRPDILLETRLEPRLAPVDADPSQLEQVLVNLVVNARDAMPSGGRLSIETRNATFGAVDVPSGRTGTAPGPWVVLVVSDTGEGMDEATRRMIFEPFFTTKEPGRGTGLGLSTVYGIVTQSGGFIDVETAPGQGATFRVCLPAAAAPAEAVAAHRQSPPPGGSEIVLLVEDEPAVRSLASRVLRNAGYGVIEAASGEEAVRLAGSRDGPIDLVLTDALMPGMSGRSLVEQLARQGLGARVLLMSGYTDDEIVRQHGALLPGTAFIQKPFTPDGLLRAVRAVLTSGSC